MHQMRTTQAMVPGMATLRDMNTNAPCGKGKIVEEHDNIPGFREHDVWIECEECSKKYKLDTSRGIRSWDLVEI